jgi:hypothetical protein
MRKRSDPPKMDMAKWKKGEGIDPFDGAKPFG